MIPLLVQVQVILSLACCLLEYILENSGAPAVLTFHCSKCGEKSKVFPPKLPFIPPAALAV